MSALATTVSAEVNTNQISAFEHIVPIDLSSIFTGYGLLPAVTKTKNQIGDWNVVGQTRTVHLSDGSTAREELTGYKYPSYFSYTVSGFTGSLRFSPLRQMVSGGLYPILRVKLILSGGTLSIPVQSLPYLYCGLLPIFFGAGTW